MDFENTLSAAAETDDTPEAVASPDTSVAAGDTSSVTASDTSDSSESGSQVIVMQSDSSSTTATRSVSLDTPTLETAGLPAVVRSVFGDYHQRTQTVTETAADGTTTTSTEPVSGLAGLDWYWLSGVFLFTIVLWSFFRFLGVVFKR